MNLTKAFRCVVVSFVSDDVNVCAVLKQIPQQQQIHLQNSSVKHNLSNLKKRFSNLFVPIRVGHDRVILLICWRHLFRPLQKQNINRKTDRMIHRLSLAEKLLFLSSLFIHFNEYAKRISSTALFLVKMQSILKSTRRCVVPSIVSFQRSLTNNLTTPWRTAYGGKYTVTLIHGDGVGPELMEHVKAAIRCVRAPIDFEDIPLSSQVANDEMFERAIMAVKRNGIALKGNLSSQNTTNSLNVLLRTRLDLYANVIRCKSNPVVPTRHSGIDILVIRQNTEGEYSSLEHESVPGVVESLKIITRAKSLKIARFAFEIAKHDQRKKVTAVHKANIMKLSDGLFVDCCREIAAEYPEIQFETMIVDNTCMQLVNRPAQFDVMVMPNLYGNIISNVCAGLVGGSGFVAGSNYGDHYAIFEQATRNTGLGIAGKNIANPSAILFAAANMLKYLELDEHCSVIKNAVLNTIQKHQIKTADIGGTSTTTQFIDCVLKEIVQMTPKLGFHYEMQKASQTFRYKNID